MPATTPRLQLPYPTPDDDVDVPRDIKALADSVDSGRLAPLEVTTLPTDPVDGQLVALSMAGGRFVLRRVGNAWICEGGTPAVASTDAGGTVAGAGAVVAPSDGALSLALSPGVWDVTWSLTAFRAINSAAGMGLTAQPQGAGLPTLGNAGAPNPECLIYFPGFGTGGSFSSYVPVARTYRFTLTGDGVINERYTGVNGTWSVIWRALRAMPVTL